jgi:hypothetical protein
MLRDGPLALLSMRRDLNLILSTGNVGVSRGCWDGREARKK